MKWKFLFYLLLFLTVMVIAMVGYLKLLRPETYGKGGITREMAQEIAKDIEKELFGNETNLYELARKTDNISYCFDIRNQFLKDFCKITLNKRKGNINFETNCNQYENLEVKDRCYYYLSQISDDKYFCDKIQGVSDKNMCYTQLAKRTKDPEICEYGYEKRDVRYIWCKAVAGNDPALCHKITETNWLKECLLEIAISAKDPRLCKNLKDEDWYKYKSICMVITLPDPSYCKGSSYCLETAAIILHNSTICDNIWGNALDMAYKIECRAITLLNKSICDEIEYKPFRDNCFEDTIPYIKRHGNRLKSVKLELLT